MKSPEKKKTIGRRLLYDQLKFTFIFVIVDYDEKN